MPGFVPRSLRVILVTLAAQKLPGISPGRVCECERMYVNQGISNFLPWLWRVQESHWHESFMTETGAEMDLRNQRKQVLKSM